jgi:uncharacterized protein
MLIEFDPLKRDKTLTERGLDFADAEKVFNGHQFTLQDERQDYSEPRFITVGKLNARMVVIVWTPRGNTRRIISMRKCNEREQALYKQRLD